MALAIAFAALAAVEVLRLGGIPGVSSPVHAFMAQFVDARDSGAFFVTHFTLLLGLAAPIWLSNAMDQPEKVSATHRMWPAALAGVVITGAGDAAASVIGSQYGQWPIARDSNKTVEGTVASVLASLAAWLALSGAFGVPLMSGSWGGSGVWAPAWLVTSTVLSSLLEASTDQLDNIFVPLHYFSLLCCL